jgi:hypothetical protein
MYIQDSFALQIVAMWVLPFVAFYLGIVIKKEVFPGPNSPSLRKQLLMGIPVSLVVVSSLIAGIQEGIREHVPAYLFTLGVLMEHGMLVSETLAHQLEKLGRMRTGESRAMAAPAVPVATAPPPAGG